MAIVPNMGNMIEFAANGHHAQGYLALPEAGHGPGVMVIQEWWGLVPQIKSTCDRLAEAGFVALAPDLFHGELAEHHEMDKAGELMGKLVAEMDHAATDMSGAVTALLEHDSVTGSSVGVVGFCMGGMLALVIAAKEGDRIGAAAPFYGAPLGEGGPDWSNLSAKVVGHFAENDDFFPPDAIKQLEADLVASGKDASFTVYPGSGHAFTNEENPLGTYDEALDTQTWAATIDLFNAALGA